MRRWESLFRYTNLLFMPWLQLQPCSYSREPARQWRRYVSDATKLSIRCDSAIRIGTGETCIHFPFKVGLLQPLYLWESDEVSCGLLSPRQLGAGSLFLGFNAVILGEFLCTLNSLINDCCRFNLLYSTMNFSCKQVFRIRSFNRFEFVVIRVDQ